MSSVTFKLQPRSDTRAYIYVHDLMQIDFADIVVLRYLSFKQLCCNISPY
jgi:hypothetical protein